MALNMDMIGKVHGPFTLEYAPMNLALYALSVGANVNGELEYVYEKNQKIIPTYWSAILGFESFTDAYYYGQSIPHTLHFGFDIAFHKPITQTKGSIQYTIELLRIFDRGEGRGSLAEIQAVAQNEAGEPCFTLVTRDIDLSTGGFGGEKPPKAVMEYPTRSPDFEVADHIGPNQAALYRIENDPNILHIDPEFAKLGGFDEPILMGMCTVGYACRALIKSLCPGRPEAIRDLKVRFTSTLNLDTPVVTQIWKQDDNTALFRLINQQTGDVVLNFCSVALDGADA